MFRWRNNGGWNKSHGTAENTPRIDSYETGAVEGRGKLFGFGSGKTLTFDCYRYTEYGPGPDVEREIVEVWHKDGWGQPLELSRKENGFGGSQAFFICPACGERRRYLYLSKNAFVCRKCAKLNYRCQQRTKNSTNHAQDGLKLAQDKLRWAPPFPVAPMDFPHVVPDRPRYMHRTTYYRYLARYRRYQEKYLRDSMREMLAILW